MIHPFLVESIKPYKSMAILRISLYNNVLFRLVISGFPMVKVPCDVYPHTWCHFCLGSDSRIVGGQGLFQMQWYHQWTGVSFRFPPKSWLCLGRSTTWILHHLKYFAPCFLTTKKRRPFGDLELWITQTEAEAPEAVVSDNNGTTEEVAEAKESAAEVAGSRGVLKKGQSDGWFPP